MDRMYKACAIVAGTLLTTAASADLIKVADSINEFSGVQGQDSWSYGWYAGDDVSLSGGAGSLDTAKFNAFEHYASGGGWWTHLRKVISSATASFLSASYVCDICPFSILDRVDRAVPARRVACSRVQLRSLRRSRTR